MYKAMFFFKKKIATPLVYKSIDSLATLEREGTSEPLNKLTSCSTVTHYVNSLMLIKK